MLQCNRSLESLGVRQFYVMSGGRISADEGCKFGRERDAQRSKVARRA